MMRFIILFFVTLFAFATQIKVRDGVIEDFVADKSIQNSSKTTVFYKYGIRNKKNTFIATNYILVRLKSGIDAKEFAKEYDLKFVKKISRLNTYQFLNNSAFNDVEICSRMVNDSRVVFAKPEFKSRKLLK